MALIEPPIWNSAHREIKYRYTYPSQTYFSSGDDGNGKLVLVIGAAVSQEVSVGQRVVIESGINAGSHSITSVTTATAPSFGSITLDADYVGGGSGYFIPLSNVNVELWAGYESGHPGNADIPLSKIADIVGVPALETYADIKVQGFLKSLFKKIESPRIGVDFRMSSPFYLVIDGTTYSTRYCLNGVFESASLNNFDNDFEILNARTPIFFENGKTIYSMLTGRTADDRGRHILNVVTANGDSTIGGVGFDAVETTFTIA